MRPQPCAHAATGNGLCPSWLGTLPRDGVETRVMLSPGATAGLRELSKPAAVLLLVGPEGGLDPEEREIAAHLRLSAPCGWDRASCAPRPQRSPPSSAMHALWGDF